MNMHQGAVRNERTGICSLIFPTVPFNACSGSPKFLSASRRNGKFSNSTSPATIPRGPQQKSTTKNYKLIPLVGK